MSALFPLYLVGLLALGLPLAFHLLRKTPRGRMEFGSLMFLSPTPPRMTRRSRLDHLLLLLLRALVLTLIVLAFARPYQRLVALLDLSSEAGDRYVVLIDVSASMQRDGVWEEAMRRVAARLENMRPQDHVALVAFQDRPRVLVGFSDDSQTNRDRSGRREATKKALQSLSPGWGASNLGGGLATAADLLVSAKDEERRDEKLEVIVVTDLQTGVDLDALQAYEWPDGVKATVEQVAAKRPTNASVRILPAGDADDGEHVRVRVVNADDSERESFALQWKTAADEAAGDAVEVYAPPGQSRVVKLKRPQIAGVNRLELQGDDANFDNIWYSTAPLQRRLRVVYFGQDEADDKQGLLFYLRYTINETPLRKVEFVSYAIEQPFVFTADNRPDVVVASATPNSEQTRQLRKYLEDGGRVWMVLTQSAKAAPLAALLDRPALQIETIEEEDYALFGQIDFKHPLFSPFSDPRFNDFTKIRFWKRCRVILGDAVEAEEQHPVSVLAQFDAGDPAMLEKRVGKGRLFVLASSWMPKESQFAISTKFVPMTTWLLDRREAAPPATQLRVGDEAAVPSDEDLAWDEVATPGGDTVKLDSDGRFTATDQPGEYRFLGGGGETAFAVNLSPRESLTSPQDPGVLESLGVKFGVTETLAAQLQRQRQKKDLELESEQDWWRWLAAAALLLLAAESWLAGWQSRSVESGMTT